MLAASLHYFRLPASSLAASLAAIRAAGFDTIDAPVPWAVHGRSGRIVFDADDAPLVALLEQSARAGLAVHLRLGPCHSEALTHFGLPASVATDRGTAALLPDGSPQVVPIPPRWTLRPSYASSRYRERAVGWIRAAAEALRPFAASGGPLRSIAVGDARPFLGRSPAFPGDFHPDALATLESARDRAATASLPDAFDPEDEAAAEAAVGAVRFAEDLYLDFVGALATAAAESIDVPIATSLPASGLFPPVGAGLLASRFERLGIDVTGWSAERRPAERDLRLVAGTASRPFASGVSLGTALHLPNLDGEDVGIGLRQALAAGLDGLVLSPAVAHDRWVGGLLDENQRDADDVSTRIRLIVHGVAAAGWLRLRRRPLAALVLPRSLARAAIAAASSLAGPIGADLLAAIGRPPALALAAASTGPAGDAWWRWFEAAERALETAGIPYVVLDDEGPVEPDPAATPLLLVPTIAEMPRTALRRIRRHVERGGRVLVGPIAPAREAGTHEPAALPREAAIVESPEASHVAAALGPAGAGSLAGDGIERSTFHGESGAPEVAGMAIVNRSRKAVPLARAAGEGSWSDLDEPGTAAATGEVPPGGIRLLRAASERRGVP